MKGKLTKGKIILLAVVTVAIGIAGMILLTDKTPTLTLKGEAEVELTVGQKFYEEGYTATDYKGKVITAQVKREMPDLTIVGDQFIKYTVTSHGKTATAYRQVKVRHKEAPVLQDYWAYENYEE